MKKFFLCIVSATLFCTNLFAAQIWPIYMDNQAYSQVSTYVVNDFRKDEINKFIYNWENEWTGTCTYNSNPCSGLNFYGNNSDYLSLSVGNQGWSGGSFYVKNQDYQKAVALRQAIIANPDNYYLHFAIKSSDNASHGFYLLGGYGISGFSIGRTSVESEQPIHGDFPRDNEWYEFYVPLSAYGSKLVSIVDADESMNILEFASGGIEGTILNLDAIYFCDADFMYNVDIANRIGGCPFIVNHRDKDNEMLSIAPVTLQLPTAPDIIGFTFVGWKTVEEIIGTTINIQAVYTYNGEPTPAPAVVVNPANPAQKLIRNGNVYILTEDKTYTVTGQEIR